MTFAFFLVMKTLFFGFLAGVVLATVGRFMVK